MYLTLARGFARTTLQNVIGGSIAVKINFPTNALLSTRKTN